MVHSTAERQLSMKSSHLLVLEASRRVKYAGGGGGSGAADGPR